MYTASMYLSDRFGVRDFRVHNKRCYHPGVPCGTSNHTGSHSSDYFCSKCRHCRGG